MSILGKKNKNNKGTEEKKQEKKDEGKEVKNSEEQKKVKKSKSTKKDFAYDVLISPHITEKATNLSEENKYVFKVFSRSNKIMIRKAIETEFNAKVDCVKIINAKSKKRRLGRTIGRKPGYKKAIVKLKSGEKIEVLPK